MNTIVILGGGISGLGSALLAKRNNYNVFVSDTGSISDSTKDILIKSSIKFEEYSHEKAKTIEPDLIIISPGIPPTCDIITFFMAKSIKMISEIEFASIHCKSQIIAITGSNGKTTTTTLTHKLISDAGFSCSISGNIGNSFSDVCEDDVDFSVLEVSSFQLDRVDNFKPHIAIITSITPDHLDRYKNFEAYVDSKFKMIKNQSDEDYLIYDSDCKTINKYIKTKNIKSKLFPFSLKKKVKKGAFFLKNEINIITHKNKFNMSTKNFLVKGNHNIKNAMAAATVANLLKIRKETIRKSLEHFQGVEHRLENVLTINKVKYINDSKATNVNAAYYALESMESPTIWIVGGVDKGNNYSELLKVVNKRVKAIICLGLNNLKIIDQFENAVEYIIETKSMSEAVRAAYKISSAGDCVLLSPACASFDLFDDYEDRGRQFKSEIRKL